MPEKHLAKFEVISRFKPPASPTGTMLQFQSMSTSNKTGHSLVLFFFWQTSVIF